MQQPLFGTECEDDIVGDGKITIEDVVIAMMIRYGIPPYDSSRVTLNDTTTTAPLTSYSSQCTAYEEHTDPTYAPIVPSATCDDVTTSSRRRLQSAVFHTFEILEETAHGMWVRLSISSLRGLVSANLNIGGVAVPVSTPNVNAVNVWEDRLQYQLDPVSIVVDRNGTSFTYSVTSDNMVTGFQFSSPLANRVFTCGQPQTDCVS